MKGRITQDVEIPRWWIEYTQSHARPPDCLPDRVTSHTWERTGLLPKWLCRLLFGNPSVETEAGKYRRLEKCAIEGMRQRIDAATRQGRIEL